MPLHLQPDFSLLFAFDGTLRSHVLFIAAQYSQHPNLLHSEKNVLMSIIQFGSAAGVV